MIVLVWVFGNHLHPEYRRIRLGRMRQERLLLPAGEIAPRKGYLLGIELGLARVDGEREKLVGRVQELYGITKEEAERQIDEP